MSNAEPIKLTIAKGNAKRASFRSREMAEDVAWRCGAKYWAIAFGGRFAVVSGREASILVNAGLGAWL